MNLTPFQSPTFAQADLTASSLGIRRGICLHIDHRNTPPSTCYRASTPVRCCHRTSDSSYQLESCSVLVVLHHLDGFLRSGVAGLLHPAADPRVRFVSCTRLPQSPRKQCRGPTSTFLESAVRTPRRIPLARSRTTSPWPLPSCRFAFRDVCASIRSRCQGQMYSHSSQLPRLQGVAPQASP